MERGKEFDAFLKRRRREREVRAGLAAGELYEWVGDSEAVEEDPEAAAAWLGDHVGQRVEVRVNAKTHAGTLWVVEARYPLGHLAGWRVHVDDAVWPLAVDARCRRWNRTYRAGDPPVTWGRPLLNIAQADVDLPGWVSYWAIEDCANDPPWLGRHAGLYNA